MDTRKCSIQSLNSGKSSPNWTLYIRQNHINGSPDCSLTALRCLWFGHDFDFWYSNTYDSFYIGHMLTCHTYYTHIYLPLLFRRYGDYSFSILSFFVVVGRISTNVVAKFCVTVPAKKEEEYIYINKYVRRLEWTVAERALIRRVLWILSVLSRCLDSCVRVITHFVKKDFHSHKFHKLCMCFIVHNNILVFE